MKKTIAAGITMAGVLFSSCYSSTTIQETASLPETSTAIYDIKQISPHQDRLKKIGSFLEENSYGVRTIPAKIGNWYTNTNRNTYYISKEGQYLETTIISPKKDFIFRIEGISWLPGFERIVNRTPKVKNIKSKIYMSRKTSKKVQQTYEEIIKSAHCMIEKIDFVDQVLDNVTFANETEQVNIKQNICTILGFTNKRYCQAAKRTKTDAKTFVKGKTIERLIDNYLHNRPIRQISTNPTNHEERILFSADYLNRENKLTWFSHNDMLCVAAVDQKKGYDVLQIFANTSPIRTGYRHDEALFEEYLNLSKTQSKTGKIGIVDDIIISSNPSLRVDLLPPHAKQKQIIIRGGRVFLSHKRQTAHLLSTQDYEREIIGQPTYEELVKSLSEKIIINTLTEKKLRPHLKQIMHIKPSKSFDNFLLEIIELFRS